MEQVTNEVRKESKDFLNVFHIREYINAKGEKNSEFIKIGAAFINSDGSMNLELSCLPVNGKLHIRPTKEKEKKSQ